MHLFYISSKPRPSYALRLSTPPFRGARPSALISAAAFLRYVGKAVSQSCRQPATAINADGPILTLAACSVYAHADNPRLLVRGCLKPAR